MSDISQFLIPKGFRFGATKAGLKASGRTDFALIVADVPASAAAAFTGNRVKAAPLLVDQEHLRATGGRVRVVAINAGNANCAAGQAGLDARVRHVRKRPPGVRLQSVGSVSFVDGNHRRSAAGGETDRRIAGSVSAQSGSESDHFQELAEAILTTDTVEKTAFARLEVEGREVRIAATCKGSGMIHPQLVPHATMLVYVLTDAAASPAVLDGYLRKAIEVSFNRISVDGDTSTNDTVLLLASGASGVTIDAEQRGLCGGADARCARLWHDRSSPTAKAITHVVELRIDGAASDADALKSGQGNRAFAAGEDGVGRVRSQLGTAGGGHRLLGSGDRSRAHRHLVWRAADLPRRRPGRGVRRGGGACVPAAGGVLDLHRSEPGSGIVRLLDHGPDHRVRAHQCGLLDLGISRMGYPTLATKTETSRRWGIQVG